MKIAIGLALLAVPVAACSMVHSDDDRPGIAPSGTGTSRSYPVADFTGIELAGSDDVDVRVGGSFSVRAEGPATELDRLRIDKDGSTLTIGRRRSGMSWGTHAKVRVLVTLPRLADASVAGSGALAVDRVEGSAFKGELAGSGDLRLAAMAVDRASFAIAGSGTITAAGTARALAIEVAGSGDLAAAGLRATQAKVEIAGSGDVKASVAGPATVDIMGSGDVDLGPDAQCRTTKMGSGSVRCGR